MTQQVHATRGSFGKSIIGTDLLLLDGTQPCRNVDPDIFFPESPSESRTNLVIAKQICNTCSQKAPCLEYAVTHPELEGIWAGTNERDRRSIRRAKYRKPPR